MKDVSKVRAPSRTSAKSKDNRMKLERLLRQMIYTELNMAQDKGYSSPSFGPYRRIIE